MRRLLVIAPIGLLAALCLPVAAQDTVQVRVERGAVLRFTMGRQPVTSIEGRLERSDSAVARVMVGGAEGDVKLRADRLGLSVVGDGVSDSMLVAVPWRLVRIVEVATGQRSRRMQNGLLGGVIGGGLGGGLGAVIGATASKTTCQANSTTQCGISAETGQGALAGAVLGAIVGAFVGARREAYATVWTALPERGKTLREPKPVR